jgi:hypothetical protein
MLQIKLEMQKSTKKYLVIFKANNQLWSLMLLARFHRKKMTTSTAKLPQLDPSLHKAFLKCLFKKVSFDLFHSQLLFSSQMVHNLQFVKWL